MAAWVRSKECVTLDASPISTKRLTSLSFVINHLRVDCTILGHCYRTRTRLDQYVYCLLEV